MEGPIGVFDSGFGGLTVLRHIFHQLPWEDVIFFGDNARVPYGSRRREEIRSFALEIAEFLVDLGIKILVVACNTTTAAALEDLEQVSPVPVIGIIQPGAREAARLTHSREIAVIGTEYTVKSQSYPRAIKQLLPEARVHQKPCPLFVPFVEKGSLEGPHVDAVAAEYLSFMWEAPVDVLVLGCTHYSLLAPVIRRLLGLDVRIVDPGQAVAREVYQRLQEEGLLAEPRADVSRLFYTSADPEQFRRLGQQLLGYPMEIVHQVPVRQAR